MVAAADITRQADREVMKDSMKEREKSSFLCLYRPSKS
jgi:hypothetical protein